MRFINFSLLKTFIRSQYVKSFVMLTHFFLKKLDLISGTKFPLGLHPIKTKASVVHHNRFHGRTNTYFFQLHDREEGGREQQVLFLHKDHLMYFAVVAYDNK